MKLAIVSPSQNAFSETFIQAHKKIKADEVFYYYGGYMPTHLEREGLINISKETNDFKTIFRLARKLNPLTILSSKLSLRDALLYHSFKKHKIDVVLAEFGPTAVECLRVCKTLKLPLITHFHGYDVEAIEKKHKDAYKDVFEYSSFIVAVSKEMVEDLIKLGAQENKIIYSPCGPNEIFYENKPNFRNKNMVAVGRLVDKKAPYYLILTLKKVLTKHPDAFLTIVGEGPLLNTCKNLISVLNLSNNVNLAGIKKPKEIQEIFENSSIFIQHSVKTIEGDKEGTPVGVMEASAAALPIVASRHAGIKDVVIDNVSGFLVDEHDIEAMADNIIKILDNPKLAKEMGEKGREHISDNFSLEKHLLLLSNAVKEAITRVRQGDSVSGVAE